MQKKKNKKRWIIYLVIALALFVGVALYLLWGVKDYVDKVPDITPKESMEVSVGRTLSITDIFDVECKGEYYLELRILETEIPDAEVSDDKQSVYVGSATGTIHIGVNGSGEVAEYVSGENTIVVTAKE